MTEKTIVVGDVGVLIKMDMGEDVIAAASTSMRVTKPDGSVVNNRLTALKSKLETVVKEQLAMYPFDDTTAWELTGYTVDWSV